MKYILYVLMIELHHVEIIRSGRNFVTIKRGNEYIHANYENDHQLKMLNSNLNTEVKVKSISTSVLNDIKLLQGDPINYNPNLREEAMKKATDEIENFLSSAFNRILRLQAMVEPIITATKKERRSSF